MYEIYTTPGCPFAQRVRALLTHLDEPFELKTVGGDDPDFRNLSPTGSTPFLREGEFHLHESTVIMEYLAERHGWAGAYEEDPRIRARQRLAVSRWDAVLLPLFRSSMASPEEFGDLGCSKAGREIGELESSLVPTEPASLPGLCLAPFWARIGWVRDLSAFPGCIDDRPALRDWLDRAVALEAVQQTLPDRERVIAGYRKRFNR
jgi:glutathione S-transferase